MLLEVAKVGIDQLPNQFRAVALASQGVSGEALSGILPEAPPGTAPGCGQLLKPQSPKSSLSR